MRIELTTADRERFEAKVDRSGGSDACHPWMGVRLKEGYGRFALNGRLQLAHRIAWCLAGNEITPEKPLILHNCPGGDLPACCNVRHLWAGTNADNARDRVRKGPSNAVAPPREVSDPPPPGPSLSQAQLEAAGQALIGFGQRWQRALARALPYDDRALRRWMSGERAVPGWVLGRLRELASERRAVLAPLAGEGWKPFATAPTDREILAWREDSGVLLVEWTTPEDLDPSIMDMSIEEHEEAFGDMDTSEPAWFCLAPESRLEGDELPTLWRDLPAEPEP